MSEALDHSAIGAYPSNIRKHNIHPNISLNSSWISSCMRVDSIQCIRPLGYGYWSITPNKSNSFEYFFKFLMDFKLYALVSDHMGCLSLNGHRTKYVGATAVKSLSDAQLE